jgi:hypothetical protein
MGLSHEWGNSQDWIGDSRKGANMPYRQLLSNLTAFGSGPLILRIGGDSTDSRKEPTGTTLLPFAEVAKAVNTKFILGVNLGSGNPDLAVDLVKAYVTQMPPGSIYAIEVGNEPDLYDKNGLRSSSYRMQDYYADFDNWKAHIQPLLPAGVKFSGPAWTTIPFHAPWAWPGMPGNVQTFATREAGSVSVFTQHYYATNPEAHPPQDFFLKPEEATEGPRAAAPAVAVAHANGMLFRMGEMGAISEAGVHGTSDAFGSALWAVDTMFEYANVGVDGINWLTSDGNYDSPFYIVHNWSKGVSTYTLTSVTPLYSGLLFFQAATPNQSRFLPVNVSTRANLKAWATLDASGTARVVILNKDEFQAGTVAINMPGYSRASVLRLLAPSYKSTTRVTFAGQTFDGSTDGAPHGERTVENIAGVGGVFQIPVAVTSGALVVFSK